MKPRKGRGVASPFTLAQRMSIRTRVKQLTGTKPQIYAQIASELGCTPRLVRFIVSGW
ncbi:MAG: hypothetical protein JWO52_4066 [Gammaproteobacteria bacterium]|nr:hypothetical protein [Gammaproteobacteria bacterium]